MIFVDTGGWFAYLLALRLSGVRWAAIVGGLCFGFGGYLTGYPVEQLAVLDTAIWLPLMLWALAGIVPTNRISADDRVTAGCWRAKAAASVRSLNVVMRAILAQHRIEVPLRED